MQRGSRAAGLALDAFDELPDERGWGNGGDLKPGLPLQSVFDGDRRVHEPLRLSVFVQAERSKIEAALTGAAEAARLFDNGWAHLFALEGGACHRRVRDGWERVA